MDQYLTSSVGADAGSNIITEVLCVTHMQADVTSPGRRRRTQPRNGTAAWCYCDSDERDVHFGLRKMPVPVPDTQLPVMTTDKVEDFLFRQSWKNW